MSDLDEDNDLTSTSDSDPPEPLVRWERICALIVGGVCGGAGGYAVFEKSNQAGTAMLLILAAIFLLIGVQGTPLIRFGSNSGSVELERRRRRKVQQALAQANEESSTEKAEGIVEGVKLVAPDLVPRSYDVYRLYETTIELAIRDMGYNVVREVRINDRVADLGITRNGRTIYAELKYYHRQVPAYVVDQVIGFSTILAAPVLLIASTELARSARALVGRNGVNFVQWRHERDNPELRATLERMFAEVNHKEGDISDPEGNS